MKKNLLSFLALFLSLSIYFSCTDEGVEVSGLQRINPDSDLLAYAMNLVGENGEGCSLIDFQKGNSNSRAVTDYSTVATPLWDKAKTEHHGDEEVLIVPLQGEDDIYSSMYFEEEEMGRLYQTKTFSRLVIRSKNGVNTPQIFTYLPGRNYAKNRQAVLDTMGFSPLAVKYYGTILISDLEGKFQQGFFYERGVPTIHLKAKQHTHTDACCSGDDTACDNHEHSHSLQMRLKLSGNTTIASRSYGQGEESTDYLKCRNCDKTLTNCTCETPDAYLIVCDNCGSFSMNCICIPECNFCHQRDCICGLVCVRCKQYPCTCEKRCDYCNLTFCKGECRTPEPDIEGTPGEEAQVIAPNAKEIFFNLYMTPLEWIELEVMVRNIKSDEFGGRLFNALKTSLNSRPIHVQFSDDPYLRFSSFNPSIGITLSREAQSFHLLYEMVLAYRYTIYSTELYNSTLLNGEIEALFAQCVYISRLSRFKNSIWERKYVSGMIYEEIKKITDVLDDNGQLKSGKNASDVVQAINKVVNSMSNSIKYSIYSFDSSRNGLENFNIVRTLMSDN